MKKNKQHVLQDVQNMSPGEEQNAICCTIMRGGTSKAVFIMEHDLPEPGVERNKVLLHIIDGYNLHSIDGLGGGSINTSKIVIISPSTRSDADIECQFVQIGVGDKTISYEIFCGNICSAVGPYAVDKNLVSAQEGTTTVRVFNRNINKTIQCVFSVKNGLSRVHGTSKMSGISTPGAPIFLDFNELVPRDWLDLFPTKNVSDTIVIPAVKMFHVTLFYLVNPCVFIDAKELGLDSLPTAQDFTNHSDLMAIIHYLRKACAPYFDLQDVWDNEKGHGPMLPYAIIVDSNAHEGRTLNIRAVHLKECHPSIPASCGISTAVASCIPGTIPFLAAQKNVHDGIVSIGHPQGVMDVEMDADWDTVQQQLAIRHLGFKRTARRMMDGWVYVLK